MSKQKIIDAAKTDPDYDYFIKADLSRYENQWIAISGRKVIAHNKRADLMFKKAKKLKPLEKISFTKVLSQKPMIFSYL